MIYPIFNVGFIDLIVCLNHSTDLVLPIDEGLGSSAKHYGSGSLGSGSAGSVYLSDSQDWVVSPSCSPDEGPVQQNTISPMLAEETFRYMSTYRIIKLFFFKWKLGKGYVFPLHLFSFCQLAVIGQTCGMPKWWVRVNLRIFWVQWMMAVCERKGGRERWMIKGIQWSWQR